MRKLRWRTIENRHWFITWRCVLDGHGYEVEFYEMSSPRCWQIELRQTAVRPRAFVDPVVRLDCRVYETRRGAMDQANAWRSRLESYLAELKL